MQFMLDASGVSRAALEIFVKTGQHVNQKWESATSNTRDAAKDPTCVWLTSGSPHTSDMNGPINGSVLEYCP